MTDALQRFSDFWTYEPERAIAATLSAVAFAALCCLLWKIEFGKGNA
jgi:hypothetical protein